jgi:glycosyltransferase involved in cell wall biosynthesis
MSPTDVSVVIPVHNRLAFLRQALDSVAEQTAPAREVIVVDDGSTEDIAGGIGDHRCRPRVVRQLRRGPAAARNRGIEAAGGEWIAFLDSDDLWMPQKLERFLEEVGKRPDINIFYGPMLPIDADGRPMSGRSKPRHDGWITELLFESCFVDVPTVLCRRTLLDRCGGFDAGLAVCEDYDLWLRISLAEPFGLVPEPLARRRLHADRLSKQDMSRNLRVKAEVLERFLARPDVNGKIPSRVAASRLARVCFVAGRSAYAQGQYHEAMECCRKSRRFGPAPFRTWLLSTAAATRSWLSGNGNGNGEAEGAHVKRRAGARVAGGRTPPRS